MHSVIYSSGEIDYRIVGQRGCSFCRSQKIGTYMKAISCNENDIPFTFVLLLQLLTGMMKVIKKLLLKIEMILRCQIS